MAANGIWGGLAKVLRMVHAIREIVSPQSSAVIETSESFRRW